MQCTITEPGHATNLTGVKLALAGGRSGRSLPVPATVASIDGEHIIIELPGATVEASCHDVARLAVLLDVAELAAGNVAGDAGGDAGRDVAGDAAGSGRRAAPRALFSAEEHQLLVEVDPELHARGIGTEYVSPRSSTGVLASFNVALPWHAHVPCGRQAA